VNVHRKVSELNILVSADDVTDSILESVTDCVDWFDEGPMPAEEFIDRLCSTYATDWDLHHYDSEAAKKIMKHARKERRNRKS